MDTVEMSEMELSLCTGIIYALILTISGIWSTTLEYAMFLFKHYNPEMYEEYYIDSSLYSWLLFYPNVENYYKKGIHRRERFMEMLKIGRLNGVIAYGYIFFVLFMGIICMTTTLVSYKFYGISAIIGYFILVLPSSIMGVLKVKPYVQKIHRYYIEWKK